jgi:threonine dehydrogenase-like Zn-dependent dehydrogenase
MNIALPADTSMLRAAVLTGPRTFELRNTLLPAPGQGEVRIRLEGCGVCASNVTPWEGPEWMTFPTEPGGLGHEGWGVVDAIGEGVTGISPGDRVAALSFHAYASHDLADEANVVRLPPELADVPFPGEPLGCAMNIFQRSNMGPGQTVAIVGIGFLGAILTRLASAAGATVIAVGRRPFALKLAKRMGAAETIEMDDHWSIIEKVRSLTDGHFCDCVVEAVGKQWPLDLAGELTRERGRLVIAGYHQDGPRQVNMQMWNWRGLDVINAHERDPSIYVEGIRKAVRATVDGLIDPAGLITHRLPPERLSDALAMTRDRPDGFLKAVVEFR